MENLTEETFEISSTNTMSVLDVCIPDIVGNYDSPDEVAEWAWIQANATYEHTSLGQYGIWEFMVNLSYELSDVPEKLLPIINAAKANDFRYILFHQGT